jgi:ribosomal protein S2
MLSEQEKLRPKQATRFVCALAAVFMVPLVTGAKKGASVFLAQKAARVHEIPIGSRFLAWVKPISCA